MTYVVGSPVPLDFTTRVGTVLTDPTTFAVSIQQPDGTVLGPFTWVSAAVSKLSAGTFRYLFTPTQVGRHVAAGVSTGTAAGGYSYPFDVTSMFDAPLVSLAEARAHLNSTGAKVGDDWEIDQMLAAATDRLEAEYGPLRGQVRTRTLSTFGQTALYPGGAIVSVLNPLGVALTGWTSLDGVLTFSSYLPATVTVTYRTEPAAPASVARLAVLDMLADLWRSQRGGSAPGGPFSIDQPAGGGYQAPRWKTLMEPYRVPAIA